ncbi:MAG: Nramp family divalent metal transporter [Aliiglaciecola sp.]
MKKIGPALLVTAAFIGPGTVTTASLAGGSYGFALVWALLFSVIATFVLQEMASRLGLATGSGLAQAIREQFTGWVKWAVVGLIVCAIGIGNAAYQAGNLTGAALGLSSVAPGHLRNWVWVLGLVATTLLYLGRYELLERVLIGLVGLMSLVFFSTMLMASPDWSAMLKGALSFSIPNGSILVVIALIGTTIVPYNLFLHASIVAAKRNESKQDPKGPTDLDQAIAENRFDAAMSIGLGGIITLSILACSASVFFATQTQVQTSNIAAQLEPLLGSYANLFFALGLFAAGLTSAITAPLAAAYAVSGALGWNAQLNSPRFRAIWLTVMLAGVLVASLGLKPLAAILFAQATNGLLLPIIALFLIWVMNNSQLMGQHRNGMIGNLIGGLIVLFVSALGLYKLISLFF